MYLETLYVETIVLTVTSSDFNHVKEFLCIFFCNQAPITITVIYSSFTHYYQSYSLHSLFIENLLYAKHSSMA